MSYKDQYHLKSLKIHNWEHLKYLLETLQNVEESTKDIKINEK